MRGRSLDFARDDKAGPCHLDRSVAEWSGEISREPPGEGWTPSRDLSVHQLQFLGELNGINYVQAPLQESDWWRVAGRSNQWMSWVQPMMPTWPDGPAYSLKIARPEYVCIQISVSGTYNRWINGQVDPVNPAMIDITNTPLSISDTQASTRLCGVLIAYNREYLIDHFKLNVDRVPAAYRSIFRFQSW